MSISFLWKNKHRYLITHEYGVLAGAEGGGKWYYYVGYPIMLKASAGGGEEVTLLC